jgi:hypothetical protein
MDLFEFAGDLPRENYCKRQREGRECLTRTQCTMCQLYEQGLLPAHYPVPAVIYFVVPVVVEGYCLRVEIINASGADIWPVEFNTERQDG